MKWLIWKEYRVNRPIVILGAILLVLPYVVFLVLAWYGAEPLSRDGTPRWDEIIGSSALLSIGISQLTLGLLGGHAIAGERVDRSAEFQAYLPVSRTRILAGKITLALLAAVLIWGLNLLALLIVLLASSELPEGIEEIGSVLGTFAITGLVFFCVGWLLSSMLRSPTFAILAGLITPLLIVMGINTFPWAFEYPSEEILESWYRGICLALAPPCFVVGTWYYLRRVEP